MTKKQELKLMDAAFILWYDKEYPIDSFDSNQERREHQKISYGGWCAYRDCYVYATRLNKK